MSTLEFWRVVVVGASPEKIAAASAVLESSGFASTGVFSEEEATRAITCGGEILAVVAGGSVDEPAQARLRAEVAAKGGVLLATSIGHDDPRAHFIEHVVPRVIAERDRQQALGFPPTLGSGAAPVPAASPRLERPSC